MDHVRHGAAAYDERTMADVERPYFDAFRRFYRQLPRQRDLFYLFVSNGLLHWARKALQFVPSTVNLVVVGSSLSPAELAWIHIEVDRPFHHIALPVDDKTVWDFLFRANEYDFGWVDADCFVLNPALFPELLAPSPGAAVRAVWAHSLRRDVLADPTADVRLARTHFMTVAAGALDEIRRRVEVSACTYNYDGSRSGRTFERALYAVSRMPTRPQTELLAQVLRTDAQGRPAYPLPGFDFFDTTFLYQLVALALGHRVETIRDMQTECSAEVIHVGGISYYRRWALLGGAWKAPYRRVAAIDLLLLLDAGGVLPPEYDSLRDRIAAQLQSDGVGVAEARRDVRALAAESGVAAAAMDDDPRLAFLAG